MAQSPQESQLPISLSMCSATCLKWLVTGGFQSLRPESLDIRYLRLLVYESHTRSGFGDGNLIFVSYLDALGQVVVHSVHLCL